MKLGISDFKDDLLIFINFVFKYYARKYNHYNL